MQDGIGRSAHGDIERHGVLERTLAGDGARQSGQIVLFVITAGEIDSAATGLEKSSLRSEWVANVEPFPGSDRPSASVRQFIEFAVNMPEQEPQVGQAERSMTATSSS